MSDLIEKRDERTRKRKQIKRKMDKIIGLSFHDKDKKVMSLTAEPQMLSDNKARLIDEGYIDNGFVIKKGALEKYLKGENQYVRGWEFDGEEWHQTEVLNLNSDFVGTVNLGHMDFAQMPFILGEWTKDDLTLVDIENDRKALDVTLHLDEESMFIKELKRQNHDIGISAEFWVHENYEDTEALSETLGYYLPVFDEIYIFAYGLVGECGNVNSSGLELKGEPMENMEELIEIIESDEEKDLAIEDEVSIPTMEEAETEEAEENEPAEEETEEEEVSEEAPDGEEAEVEEVGEDADEEDDSEEAEDADAEMLSLINDLKEQIQTLTNKVNDLEDANKALKKSNRKLSAKHQKELDKKAEFIETLKGVSVELLPDEDKKEEKEEVKVLNKNYVRDGIGEI